MTIRLSNWHGSQSGLEFITYNDGDNLHEIIMNELKNFNIKVHAKSRLFVICDKVTKLQLEAILKKFNRTDVIIKEC